MNAVQIEQAVTRLCEDAFDAAEFPFEFLLAYGNKDTTIKRLRKDANKSDLGGVLQTGNIHIAVAAPGGTSAMLAALRASPATTKARAKFILATDGALLEAEDLASGETLACAFVDFPNHFTFLLQLAGITMVKALRENAFDVRATSGLNRLYVQLLKDNPDWAGPARRADMNHFMARLIFCFFAEDTDIFGGTSAFSSTIETFASVDSANTHEVLATVFRALNTRQDDRAGAGLPRWTAKFPYVNGGLFAGAIAVPVFSKISRSYLLHIGRLDWKQINPDIFGSMIQAVADDEERSNAGMHYTSVPNILKVLNPLFLDDLREKLDQAGSNPRQLLALRKRMARIRVFDPACGSGNFLVIAYKEMRAIEAEINKRRNETNRRSELPLTNYRGIELRDFSAEVARLALIIAEYQCDVLHRGPQHALKDFLPLAHDNWITCGNALRLDWLSICPPTGTGVKHQADDLFQTPLDQAQIDFENEGGETYICGNPPYLGSKWQSESQKDDLRAIFDGRIKNWKSLDYVAGWFMKAADYGTKTNLIAALVSTNSICQGQQVPILWPEILATGHEIVFAHTSFKWSNLASHKAGVTVVIVGISSHAGRRRQLFTETPDGGVTLKVVDNINAYLVPAPNIIVQQKAKAPTDRSLMQFGNHPYYASDLILTTAEASKLTLHKPEAKHFLRPFYGSTEFISNSPRACLWITDNQVDEARRIPAIAARIDKVKSARLAATKDASAKKLATTPHRFREQITAKSHCLVVPRVSSENRPYLPVGLLNANCIIQEKAFALYDAPLWNMALIASRLHWVWIGTVCARMRTDFSYSNTLGWNTFPVPTLTENNRAELTRCAEDILLAREAHFPATIADLYDPETMPADLRAAHERNDEVLERIYIGRRFRNDAERLEKLFDMYTKMSAAAGVAKPNLEVAE